MLGHRKSAAGDRNPCKYCDSSENIRRELSGRYDFLIEIEEPQATDRPDLNFTKKCSEALSEPVGVEAG